MPDLFGQPDCGPYPSDFAPIRPADPHVSPAEAPRLSGQCSLILGMLRRGRCTNVELAAVALKYTSRCSDLREAGFDVRVVERNHSTGVCVYALFDGGNEVESNHV